jgi:hypothetical protein
MGGWYGRTGIFISGRLVVLLAAAASGCYIGIDDTNTSTLNPTRNRLVVFWTPQSVTIYDLSSKASPKFYERHTYWICCYQSIGLLSLPDSPRMCCDRMLHLLMPSRSRCLSD